jgi:cytochrome P450 family 13
MLLTFLYWLSFSSLFIFIYLYIQSQYWKRRNVPGPPTHLILGNIPELTQQSKAAWFQLRDWTLEYGNCYGIMEGARRLLILSDPEKIADVFSKKFEYFHSRRPNHFVGDVDDMSNQRVHVFSSRGSRWKRLRAISTPVVAASNIKKLFPTIVDCINVTLETLETHSNETIDIHVYIKELVMDIVCRVGLGQKESKQFNNEFVSHFDHFFGQPAHNPINTLVAMFPVFTGTIVKYAIKFGAAKMDFINQIYANLGKVVSERKQKREKLKQNSEKLEMEDFIDFFLEAEASEVIEDTYVSKFERSQFKTERKMTSNEIVANLVAFLVAGYDTTQNSLAFLCFELATHPEIQKRVQDEIDENCPFEEIEYDQVQKLTFTEACIKESLRKYPVALGSTARQCTESTSIGKDSFLVEKDTVIVVDSLSTNYNPELWGENPNEFNPDRWLEGNPKHQMAFMPFGGGPRLCIGNKFALIEEKLILSMLLRKYTLEEVKETRLEQTGFVVLAPSDIKVKLVPRF